MWLAGGSLAERRVYWPSAFSAGRCALSDLGDGGSGRRLPKSNECGSCWDWVGDSGGECGKGKEAFVVGSSRIRKAGSRRQPRLGKLLGRRGVVVKGRSCIGIEAGTRSGKWSVIMD